MVRDPLRTSRSIHGSALSARSRLSSSVVVLGQLFATFARVPSQRPGTAPWPQSPKAPSFTAMAHYLRDQLPGLPYDPDRTFTEFPVLHLPLL